MAPAPRRTAPPVIRATSPRSASPPPPPSRSTPPGRRAPPPGGAPPTRRMRAAAKQVLGRSSVEGGSGALVHAVPVSRWDQPFAALALRTRTGQTSRSIAFADETAAAVGLAPEPERAPA